MSSDRTLSPLAAKGLGPQGGMPSMNAVSTSPPRTGTSAGSSPGRPTTARSHDSRHEAESPSRTLSSPVTTVAHPGRHAETTAETDDPGRSPATEDVSVGREGSAVSPDEAPASASDVTSQSSPPTQGPAAKKKKKPKKKKKNAFSAGMPGDMARGAGEDMVDDGMAAGPGHLHPLTTPGGGPAPQLFGPPAGGWDPYGPRHPPPLHNTYQPLFPYGAGGGSAGVGGYYGAPDGQSSGGPLYYYRQNMGGPAPYGPAGGYYPPQSHMGGEVAPPLPPSSSPPSAAARGARTSAATASSTNNNSAVRSSRQRSSASSAGASAEASLLPSATVEASSGMGRTNDNRSANSSFATQNQAPPPPQRYPAQPPRNSNTGYDDSGNGGGTGYAPRGPMLFHHHHHHHQQHAPPPPHTQGFPLMGRGPAPANAYGSGGGGYGVMHGAVAPYAPGFGMDASATTLRQGGYAYSPRGGDGGGGGGRAAYPNAGATERGMPPQPQGVRQGGGSSSGGGPRGQEPPPRALPLPRQQPHHAHHQEFCQPWPYGASPYGWTMPAHDPYAVVSEGTTDGAARHPQGTSTGAYAGSGGGEAAQSTTDPSRVATEGRSAQRTPSPAPQGDCGVRRSGSGSRLGTAPVTVGPDRAASGHAETQAGAECGPTPTVSVRRTGARAGAGVAAEPSREVAHTRVRVPRDRWFTPEVSTRLSTLVENEVLRYLMPSIIGLTRRRRQLQCLATHITDAIHDVGARNQHTYGQVCFYIFGSVNMRTVLPDGDNDLTVLVDGLLPSAKDTTPITAASLHPDDATEGVEAKQTAAAALSAMPSTTDSNSGNKAGTLHMATLADGRPVLAPPAAIGIAAGELLSGVRDYLHAHHTPIYVDALVSAEVRVLKLAMEGSSYDLTVGQFGGVNCVRFLHEMDAAVGGAHLLKRSLLLLKSWCCYEAHVLGGQGGYIGSYAATVMLIAMLNTVEFLEDVKPDGQPTAMSGDDGPAPSAPATNTPLFSSADAAAGSLPSPLRLVARFLKFYRHFDFDHYCVTAFGPLPLPALSAVPFDLSLLEATTAPAESITASLGHGESPVSGHTHCTRAEEGSDISSSSDGAGREKDEAALTAEQVDARARAAICHTPRHSRPVCRNAHGVDVNFLGLTPEGEKAIGHLVRRRRKPLLTVSGVKHLLHEMNQSRLEERLTAFEQMEALRQQRHKSGNGADGANAGTTSAAAATNTNAEGAPSAHVTDKNTEEAGPSVTHRFTGLNRTGNVQADAALLCPSCNTRAFPVRSMNVLDPLRWSSNMVRGVSRNHLQRIVRAFEEGLRRFALASHELADETSTTASAEGDADVDTALPQPDSTPSRTTLRGTTPEESRRAEDSFTSAGAPATRSSLDSPSDGLSPLSAETPADHCLPGYPAPNSLCTQREVSVLRFIFGSTISAIQRNSAVNCPWDISMQDHADGDGDGEDTRSTTESDWGTRGDRSMETGGGAEAPVQVPLLTTAAAGAAERSDATETSPATATRPAQDGDAAGVKAKGTSRGLLHACPHCKRASIFCTPDIPVMCQPQVTFNSPALAHFVTPELLAKQRREGPLGEQLLPSDAHLAELGLSAHVGADDGTGGGVAGYDMMPPTMLGVQPYPMMPYGGERYLPTSQPAVNVWNGNGGAGGRLATAAVAYDRPGVHGQAYNPARAPYDRPHGNTSHTLSSPAAAYPGAYYGGGGSGAGRAGAQPGVHGDGNMPGYMPEVGRHTQRGRMDGYGAGGYGPMPGSDTQPTQYLPSPDHFYSGGGTNNDYHRRVMSGASGYHSGAGGSTAGASGRPQNNNNNGAASTGDNGIGTRRQGGGPPPPQSTQPPLVVAVGRRPGGGNVHGGAKPFPGGVLSSGTSL